MATLRAISLSSSFSYYPSKPKEWVSLPYWKLLRMSRLPYRIFVGLKMKVQTMRSALVLIILLLGCENRETQLQRFLLQGNEALGLQNYQGAEYYFLEALKLDACFLDALNNLGVLNAAQKHFDVAITYFDKAIACDANFMSAYFNRANSLYESKEYYSLVKDAELILKIKPDTAVGHVLNGLARVKLLQYKEALDAFSKAIVLEPNNAEHYVNRGTVKYYQKNLTEATSDFRKALQLLPTQANALNALGLIATDKNQLDSAKRFFNDALKIIPQQPYFLNNLGYIYLQQNELDQAKTLIDLSITLDPDNAWAYRNKGIYYLTTSEFTNAERLLKLALDMDDRVDKIHYYYGLALLKNGKNTEACDQLRKSEAAGDDLVKQEIKQACR